MATTIGLNVLLPTVGGDTDLWGGFLNTSLTLLVAEHTTKTIDQNFADKVLSRPVLKDYGETSQAVSYAASITVDLENGNHVTTTLTGNIISVTISNPPASGVVGILRWKLKQDATGGRTITLPSSFKPANNTTPVFDTAANRTNILTAVTDDSGTSWDYRVESGFVGL